MRPDCVEEASALTIRRQDGRAALLERAIRRKQAAAGARASDIPPRPADQEARLGEMQGSLWLQHQLEPQSAAYHLASAFRVPASLSVPEMERSLNEVVSRHRILRSTFPKSRNGAPRVAQADWAIGIERICAEPGAAEAAAVQAARRPFDLEGGSLIRLLLVEEPAGAERLVVLVLHHILADQRSLALLWGELAECYDRRGPSGSRGAAPIESQPRAQYDDYVHWLLGRDSGERDAALAFWRNRLEPPPPDLSLAFERTTPRAGGARGRLLLRPVRFETDAVTGGDASLRIRRVASAAGTTPFVVLAFVFRLLLQRYTGGLRGAFATPVSTRSHPSTAEMIGYFLNPVVIDAPIDEQAAVEQALQRFDREMRACLARASISLDVLIEELSPPRRPDRHPLFQAMFVYQEPQPAPVLGGVRLEPVSLDLGESKFDLTLFASTGPPSVEKASTEIGVEYRADRFDAIWMENLLQHYETLLGQLVDTIERSGAQMSAVGLGMLSSEEDYQIRGFEEGASPDKAEPDPLPVQILRQARRSPEAPAVLSTGEAWSYAELESAGHRIAGELERAGVGLGDRVGLSLDRSPQMIAGILGIHWAGAAYVPLDPAYPPERTHGVLEDARVAAVLTRPALAERVPDVGAPVIEVNSLPGGDDGVFEAECSSGDLPAYILYTSGSTGRPKGVVVTHENLRASTAARRQFYDAPPERFLLLPSVAFDSSVAGIFWTLAEGGTLVIPADDEVRDPRQLKRLIASKRVTSLLCVPSLYAHLLRAGEEQLNSLETVIVAGENCPPQLVEEHFRTLPGARLFNEYGPTEATVWATVHEIEPSDADQSVPIGRPIAGVRIEVLDALGRRLPAGIPGEGWIWGTTVAEGYWQRRELTEERFVAGDSEEGGRGRAFRTGDRLSWTPEGSLLFHGRVDEQIKLRGFRIEPGEIEAALLEVPGVREAAVAVRDGDWLVAFIVTAEPFASSSLQEHLSRHLPRYMVPGRFVELAGLPRLANGKVDRRRLREMPLKRADATETVPPILNDRERGLLSLWEGLLGRSGIGPGDNFFQLGGHSLAVVEMTAAIERDFGVTLAPAEVFQNPTIRELAERIELEGGEEASAYAHLFPIEPGGHKSPFIFCIPHFFSGMVATRFRGERPVYGLRGVGLRPEGNRGRWRSMQDLGHELVDEVLRRFPDQVGVIAGYSFGCTMAFELVRQLEALGVPAERLYLIAPMPLDFIRFGPLRVQLDGLRQPIKDVSLGQALGHFARDNSPFTRRPYSHAWRLMAVEPWRRFLCAVGKLRTFAGLPLTQGILYADVRVERFRLHAGYRPGAIRTPTTIFNAREPATDAAATWRPHFEGPFTVHDIPDPHLGDASIRAAKKLILEHLAQHEDS